jgi:hypothetical protein
MGTPIDTSTGRQAGSVPFGERPTGYLAWLIEWLQEHAIGDYKPCAEAAQVLEAQAAEIKRLRRKP